MVDPPKTNFDDEEGEPEGGQAVTPDEWPIPDPREKFADQEEELDRET